MIMDRNYDRFPATRISGRIIKGWESIRKTLSERGHGPLAVDFYTGVYEDEVIGELSKGFGKVLNTRDLMKPEDEVLSMTSRFMTDCRQVMAEYQTLSGKPMRIIMYGTERAWKFDRVDDILPFIFDSFNEK